MTSSRSPSEAHDARGLVTDPAGIERSARDDRALDLHAVPFLLEDTPAWPLHASPKAARP